MAQGFDGPGDCSAEFEASGFNSALVAAMNTTSNCEGGDLPLEFECLIFERLSSGSYLLDKSSILRSAYVHRSDSNVDFLSALPLLSRCSLHHRKGIRQSLDSLMQLNHRLSNANSLHQSLLSSLTDN